MRRLLLKENELGVCAVILIFLAVISAYPQLSSRNIVGLAGGSCVSPRVGETITVSGTTTLCPGTYVALTFSIGEDNSVLDCSDSLILGPESRMSFSSKLQGITVRNCRFHGTSSLSVSGGKDVVFENIEMVGTVSDQAIMLTQSFDGTWSDNILLRNITINKSRNHGILSYRATNVLMENIRIDKAGRNAIRIMSSGNSLRDVVACHSKRYYENNVPVQRDIWAESPVSEQTSLTCGYALGVTCDNSCPPEEPDVWSDCYDPYDFVREYDFSSGNVVFCPGTYYLPRGFEFTQEHEGDVSIDCQGATLKGREVGVVGWETGIVVEPKSAWLLGGWLGPWGDVAVKNCNIEGFPYGIQTMTKYCRYVTNTQCSEDDIAITVENVHVRNNSFGWITHSMSQLGHPSSVQKEVLVRDSSFVGNDVGLVGQFDGLLLEDTLFSNNGVGINFSFENRNNVIRNNRFVGNGVGLLMNRSGQKDSHVFEGNVFDNLQDISCWRSLNNSFLNNTCESILSVGCCVSGSPSCQETPRCNEEGVEYGEMELSDLTSPCGGEKAGGLLKISHSTTLCPMTVRFDSLDFASDDITLDCNGAVLEGRGLDGLLIQGRRNIVIKNCDLKDFNRAVLISQSQDVHLVDNEMHHNEIAVLGTLSSRVRLERNSVSDQRSLQEGSVVLSHLTDAVLRDNLIFSLKYGVVLQNMTDVTIEGNVFTRDQASSGAMMNFNTMNGESRNVTVRRNRFNGGISTSFIRSLEAIQKADISENVGFGSSVFVSIGYDRVSEHVTIKNNVCVRCRGLVNLRGRHSVIEGNSLVNDPYYLSLLGLAPPTAFSSGIIVSGDDSQIVRNYLETSRLPLPSDENLWGIGTGHGWDDSARNSSIRENVVRNYWAPISAPYFASYKVLTQSSWDRLDPLLFGKTVIEDNVVSGGFYAGVSTGGSDILVRDNRVYNITGDQTANSGTGVLVRKGNASLFGNVLCGSAFGVNCNGFLEYHGVLTSQSENLCDGINSSCGAYSCQGACVPQAIEICTDGIDNDLDGFVDCVDPFCQGFSVCTFNLIGQEAVCGDGFCVLGESCSSCQLDCGACPPQGGSCGDGVCGVDEVCDVCVADCGECELCMPIAEICTNGEDDDCDGLVDGDDADCDDGSSPLVFKGSSPVLFKGSSPLVFKLSGGNNQTNNQTGNQTNNQTGNQTGNQSNQSGIPQWFNEMRTIGGLVIKVQSRTVPVIQESFPADAPDQARVSFRLLNATDARIELQYQVPFSLYKRQSSYQWALLELVKDPASMDVYYAGTASDGEYAVVEKVQVADDPIDEPPLDENPAGSGSWAWLFILFFVVMLGGVAFIYRQKLVEVYQENFASVISHKKDEPVKIAPPKSVAPPVMHRSSTATPRLEAKRLLQSALLGGKDLDDAKLELVKKGFDARIVETVAEELGREKAKR